MLGRGGPCEDIGPWGWVAWDQGSYLTPAAGADPEAKQGSWEGLGTANDNTFSCYYIGYVFIFAKASIFIAEQIEAIETPLIQE